MYCAKRFSDSAEDCKDVEKQILKAARNISLLGPKGYGVRNYIRWSMISPDQQRCLTLRNLKETTEKAGADRRPAFLYDLCGAVRTS